MKRVFTCFVLTLFFISCGNSQEIESITTAELKEVLSNDKIQLLDVRTAAEIKDGAIETAIFVDFYSDNFTSEVLAKLNKNKPVYIYCRSGNRSMKASILLQEKGYKVLNVSGGFAQWKK